MAALYVLFFSGFFRLSRAELAVLFVTIGAVLSAEVFNTAAEDLCDYVSPGFARRIGSVKDLAAGAVLLSALAAVGVGIVLFWRPERFAVITAWFWDAPWRLALLLVSLPAAAALLLGRALRVGNVLVNGIRGDADHEDRQQQDRCGRSDRDLLVDSLTHWSLPPSS